jgi:hypothetical protein
VCVHVYIYVYVYVYTYIYTHAHTHTHTLSHTYTHTHTHSRASRTGGMSRPLEVYGEALAAPHSIRAFLTSKQRRDTACHPQRANSARYNVH